MKVAIVQKVVPWYREEFFSKLSQKANVTLFLYDKAKNGDVEKSETIKMKHIRNISFKNFRIVSLFTLLFGGFDVLVLELHKGHITTWLLLLLKFIHRKKIILWGHGISVKRYLTEEKQLDKLLCRMVAMADGLWLYTQKEEQIWQKRFPLKKIVALGNTISDVQKIIDIDVQKDKIKLKTKYNVTQPIIFIYCARFLNNYRRIDLLVKLIEKLDNKKYGFIIIGSGNFKPDFSKYNNVYDYNAVYDSNVKKELFSIADLYIQPGWVGLSIVEAMAYAKPIITFERSKDILQCVEYSYLVNDYNAIIVNSVDELYNKIIALDDNKIRELGDNARKFVKENLSITNMVNNAYSLLA